MTKLLLFLILLSALLMHTACGYQLRGEGKYKLKNIWVKANPETTTLATKVRTRIKNTGGSVVTNSETANLILILDSFDIQRSVQVETSDGRISDFNIKGVLRYRIHDAKENEAETRQREIFLDTVFIRDSTNLIANAEKETTLIAEMQDNIVKKLLDFLWSTR